MFVGVQHPGTGGAGHFPGGGNTMPRSSIIAGTREDGQRIEQLSFIILGNRGLLRQAVFLQPSINQGNDFIDNVELFALLRRNCLHQTIDPFDMWHTSRQRPCCRGWIYKAVRSVCIFFKRHLVRGVRAKVTA